MYILNHIIAKLLTFGVVFGTFCTATAEDDGRTPFCKRCKCSYSVPNDPPDVACDLANIDYLNRTYWFDALNHSYPISSLNLRSNNIPNLIDPIPVSNLTVLDFTNNFIVRVEANVFSQLQKLQTLILSNNYIENLVPDVFKGLRLDGYDYPLRALKQLKLNDNKLHTLNQDVFKHVDQNIEILDLSHNPFKVIDLQTTIAIGSLVYLKELYISVTQLKMLPEHFLHTPKYLHTLDLSGNQFQSIPAQLGDTHGLRVLYFNKNPIVNITRDNGFPRMPTLKTLHMSASETLSEIGSHGLGGLENLEELHICNNIELSTINANALTRRDGETEVWPQLKKIYLQNNKLSYLESDLVLHWNGLTDFDIRNNPWVCECENQWMVDDLIPLYKNINETYAKEVLCAAPSEMKGETMYELHEKNSTMRCLDLYGNHPENDATILIGILIGLLIAIPLVLFMMFAYQRRWFGIFDKGPAAFSRQFYSRTHSDEL